MDEVNNSVNERIDMQQDFVFISDEKINQMKVDQIEIVLEERAVSKVGKKKNLQRKVQLAMQKKTPVMNK